VAFDKVREGFQRADVILSPLRLPVPPRPLLALFKRALALKMNRLRTLDEYSTRSSRRAFFSRPNIERNTLCHRLRQNNAMQIKDLSYFPATRNEPDF
jgi:hypothetical protein